MHVEEFFFSLDKHSDTQRASDQKTQFLHMKHFATDWMYFCEFKWNDCAWYRNNNREFMNENWFCFNLIWRSIFCVFFSHLMNNLSFQRFDGVSFFFFSIWNENNWVDHLFSIFIYFSFYLLLPSIENQIKWNRILCSEHTIKATNKATLFFLLHFLCEMMALLWIVVGCRLNFFFKKQKNIYEKKCPERGKKIQGKAILLSKHYEKKNRYSSTVKMLKAFKLKGQQNHFFSTVFDPLIFTVVFQHLLWSFMCLSTYTQNASIEVDHKWKQYASNEHFSRNNVGRQLLGCPHSSFILMRLYVQLISNRFKL